MLEITEGIYIAPEDEMMQQHLVDFALLSLSSTFHYRKHGWKKGNDYKKEPCYVMCADNHIMSLNWVDGDASLYDWQGKGVENFKKALSFIDYQREYKRKVIISCNKGISRSPTLALLYLAKRLHSIPDTSFEAAKKAFIQLYPKYKPGGIADFVRDHWNEL